MNSGKTKESVPVDKRLPKHIAIIMDGNGRWAKKRGLPRYAGHPAGVEAVRRVVEVCVELQIPILTLFAFSSENWQRPQKEVSLIMDLFVRSLKKAVRRLNRNQVKLRIIGDRSAFSKKLQKQIEEAEQQTETNQGLLLQVAANYGGRWDITQAAKCVAECVQSGELTLDMIDEEAISQHLSFADVPEPDLFIRTGGEQRTSNFLLWQCAYTELYFTDLLWPDFNRQAMDAALLDFTHRQRRFGRTGEQVQDQTAEAS
ncbi:MAG: isoprenyl transferase [Candidatus Thiodiazotropha sp. (ex Lucinoma aequizonata)]|nr:isoprenyl transferase [Candidatus Thiodiazotropha sp. (ex Lucinoma aequizonata)]MCU7887928.1 isoprenyl transferase [Candidatus Thiodiazotropha sp. (ex Lucinoma aequizonata)]MCU7897105.1 isoprenyl transferase [Candidatus Thiodiazotropha sp. (ex Lucinoma aequizonata)]MCU7899731.1 isoprenyl transferase [Candidatus Thiodiazotropha sp. (ex Lucinoma aequizonata)]MCU7901108.1 isoprenyl transferase [Candidatus Thiodiazotropha sp. (ex Lucinoma aequizonata)]